MRESEQAPPGVSRVEHQTNGPREASVQSPPSTARETRAPSALAALSPQEAEETLKRLRALSLDKEQPSALLEAAAESLRGSGYKEELGRVLREALSAPNAHPFVGALWMRRIVDRRSWNRRYPEGMDELCRRGEIGYQGVLEFLKAAGAKSKGQLVRRALRRHGKWLQKHPEGWRVAAQALVDAGEYGHAVRWMSGWRSKMPLDLPLLHCLALALRGSGRERRAREVVSLALQQPEADRQFPDLKLWHVAEEALAGQAETAAAAFKELEPVRWDDEDAICLYYLARGVIRVQRAEPAVRGEIFTAAMERVDERFRKAPVYSRDMLLRRQYRRCLWRMARDAGRWRYAWLAAWRSADTWWFLFPLVALPGLQLLLPLYLLRLCTHRKGSPA